MRRVDFKGQDLDLYKARARAHVSDHAVVRYLEREMGMDIAQVRARILSDTVVQAMILQAPAVRLTDVRLIIKDFTVVTVLPREPEAGR